MNRREEMRITLAAEPRICGVRAFGGTRRLFLFTRRGSASYSYR